MEVLFDIKCVLELWCGILFGVGRDELIVDVEEDFFLVVVIVCVVGKNFFIIKFWEWFVWRCCILLWILVEIMLMWFL